MTRLSFSSRKGVMQGCICSFSCMRGVLSCRFSWSCFFADACPWNGLETSAHCSVQRLHTAQFSDCTLLSSAIDQGRIIRGTKYLCFSPLQLLGNQGSLLSSGILWTMVTTYFSAGLALLDVLASSTLKWGSRRESEKYVRLFFTSAS